MRLFLPFGLILMVAGVLVAVIGLSGRLTHLPGTQLTNSEVLYIDNKQTFPRRIIDPLSRKMTLPEPPVAIVSNILAGDEMLTRLVDPARIRSITYLADDPGYSQVTRFYPESIPRSRGTIEETLAKEPDLVIIAAYSDATLVDMLLNTGIPVIRFTRFHSHDDIRHNVRTLARALGSEAAAERWLLEMDERIDAVVKRVANRQKPRVLSYSLNGATSGPGSLMHETITFSGGSNVIAETGLGAHSKISQEMAIALQPEVILVSDRSYVDAPSAADRLLENPLWRDVPAIRNHRVYNLRGAWVTSGSPYRVQGIEEVARLLHPEAFADLPVTRSAKKPDISP